MLCLKPCSWSSLSLHVLTGTCHGSQWEKCAWFRSCGPLRGGTTNSHSQTTNLQGLGTEPHQKQDVITSPNIHDSAPSPHTPPEGPLGQRWMKRGSFSPLWWARLRQHPDVSKIRAEDKSVIRVPSASSLSIRFRSSCFFFSSAAILLSSSARGFR